MVGQKKSMESLRRKRLKLFHCIGPSAVKYCSKISLNLNLTKFITDVGRDRDASNANLI